MDKKLKKEMVTNLIHAVEPFPGTVDLMAGDRILRRAAYFGNPFQDARQAMMAFYWGLDLLSQN